MHIVALSLCLIPAAMAATADDEARQKSKPFYLRDIQLTDTITLPFSPVILCVMLISVVLLSWMFSAPKSTATSSHILLDGDDAEARLNKLKKEINGNFTKFQSLAKVSKCPSGKSGGRLGTFSPGAMVPPFDKAIFSKDNKVGECLGPIKTNFGWHLIWIEERTFVA